MTISVGDQLPDASLLRLGEDGPESIDLSSLTSDRRVVIFGLPGAYTGTCTTAHVPSFIRSMDDLKAKGVAEVICVAVNDPFVMGAWADSTGAGAAGITMLADSDATLTKALGMDFTAPPAGLYDRSKRFALVAENGKVTVLHEEENPGLCDVSGGEAIVAAL